MSYTGLLRSVHSESLGKAEKWVVKVDKKTVFMAMTTFQTSIAYTMKNNDTNTAMFQFTIEESNVAATSNDTAVTVTITSSKDKQSLVLTFTNDSKKYYLDEAQYMYTVTENIFPNARNIDDYVTATMIKLDKAFITDLNKSYKCSLDGEIQLDSTTKRYTWLKMSGVQLQAFNITNEKFSNASICYADQKVSLVPGQWDVKNEKKQLCARIYSTVYMNITYKQISGKKRTTMIPFPKTTSATGSCSNAVTLASFDVGDGVMFNMTFTLKNTFAFADEKDYYVSAINLTYNANSLYFPNHPITKDMQKMGNMTLMLFTTPLNHSYQCDAANNVNVSTSLSVTFNTTKWQAFNVPAKKFGTASNCAQIHTTPQPVTTTAPNPIIPRTYKWAANDSSNRTCFTAKAGFQFRASYNTTKGDMLDVHFDFSNTTSTMTADDCSKDSFTVKLTDSIREQNLSLTFSKFGKNKDKYGISAVVIGFVVKNDTFLNATGMNLTAKAEDSLKSVKLMPTMMNSTYNCSMETQISLKEVSQNSTNTTNIVITIHGIESLQAFVPPKQEKPTMDRCFVDKPTAEAMKGDWKLLDSKNKACARVQSNLTLEVTYHNILEAAVTRKIPIDGNKTTILSHNCGVNSTTMTIDLENDKTMNLTLTFKKIKETGYFATADSMQYILDTVNLTYDPTNQNFQNHEGNLTQLRDTGGSSLNLYPTSVGNSFQCDLMQQHPITNLTKDKSALVVDFIGTRWEAFGINATGDFSGAEFCPAERSTTAPPTPVVTTVSPPIIPTDPTVSKFIVKDGKNVCLLANMGLQMRTTYDTKKEKDVTIAFNLNKNTTNLTATCSSDQSMVSFTLKNPPVQVNLTFTFNSKTNMTYLSEARVKYTVTKMFPNATNIGKSFLSNTSSLELMESRFNSSYSCTEETDILVNHSQNVIIRIIGVQLQAFAIKNETFSKSEHCFTDMKPKAPSTGNWTIYNNTKTICARYMFAASVNITYKTILNQMKTVMIPMDNATTDYDGACLSNASYFFVNMDGKKITFVFLFMKTNAGSKDFDYEMNLVYVQYDTMSKYFPNHAYDEDHQKSLGNSTIDLFKSDLDHSYKCTAKVSVLLNDTMGVMEFSNVRVQPFGVEKDGGFSAAKDCASDQDLSPIVPIIVGAVLGGLIIIVIIAYFIGRSRSKKIEYDTI